MPTLQEWAHARRADIEGREHAWSLYVSPRKPMGSLGFPLTVRGVWALWKEVRARRGPGIGFTPSSRTSGGQMWIYAWHGPALRGMLAQHIATLEAAGWPHDPDGFVQNVSRTPVPPMTPLYDLVATAHGDRLNPGRTDVLPGVPREDLFRTFLAVHGGPDPAFVYWRAAGLPLPEGYP